MFSSVIACAQTASTADSAYKQKIDTLNVYKSIHQYAQKHRVTRWIYQGIFRDIANPTISSRAVADIRIKADRNEQYTGKTIAYIKIIAEEPFGTSIYDTLVHPHTFIEETGNTLHIRTIPYTIRQQLLFKKGESVDPLKISESERLPRQAAYVNEARIEVKPVGKSTDSVEVLVVVRDKWSISISTSGNTKGGTASIEEDNALGLGHQLQNGYTYAVGNAANSYANGKYSINNIEHSYINAVAQYDNNPTNRFQDINVGRGFYSALTKWAGSAEFTNYSSPFIHRDTAFPLQYRVEDFWLGRSFPLSNHSIAGRSSAIVLAARAVHTHYVERPRPDLDSTHVLQNGVLYLGSIGFSSRHYYKDRNIYRFGVTEDVPEGRLLSFTGGYQVRESGPRYYTGLRLAAGNHIATGGYFAWTAEYGTYLYGGGSQSGVVNLSATWFSDLLYYRKWSARQFIYYKGVFGLDRQTGEEVNLKNPQGLLGFNSDVLGSSKLAINLQSVVYTPLNLLGFRVATVLFAGYGSSGNNYDRLVASKIYQVYGIGLLLRNENLVIRTFSLSFAFYPNVPAGDSPYKYNPISSFNVNFPDFSVGKPSQVAYQ